MTRREFMIKMLEDVFGTRYIEFRKSENCTVWYDKGGSRCKDCTYTNVYKNYVSELFEMLLNERQAKYICIKKNNYSTPEPITLYRQKALDFIFHLQVFQTFDDKVIDAMKASMIPQNCNDIFQDIIIAAIFNIGNQKNGKARSNDNFEESIDAISEAVLIYINDKLPELKKRHYKNSFFRGIAEKYPLFSELHLEEDNKIVQIHLERMEKYAKCAFGEIDFSLYEQMELMEKYTVRQQKLASIADKSDMSEDNFIELDSDLDCLCVDVQCYHKLFKKEKATDFKNAAVRVYNHLYGEGHPAYEDVTYIAAWTAHEIYVVYLFTLANLLNLYDMDPPITT